MFTVNSISVVGSADIEAINTNNNTASTHDSFLQRLKSVGVKFNQTVAVPVCNYFNEVVDSLVPLGLKFNQAVAGPVCHYFNETVDSLNEVVVDSLVPLVLRFNEAVGRIFVYIGIVLFREEVDLMLPQSTLGFIIIALLAFTEIKSQGNPKFPFHPKAMVVSVNSVVIYGLASTVEVVILSAGFDRTSIFAIIARLGRIGCLYILVVSLAALFYV